MSVFKDIGTPSNDQVNIESSIKDESSPSANVEGNFVAEGEETTAILDSLGVAENIDQLPDDVSENISVIKDFVVDTLKSKGLKQDSSSYSRVLSDLTSELGLEPNTHSSVVIDRLAGVIKGWRSLVFIKDPKEKRSIFMKLAKLPDSKSMNQFIFNEMERKSVWR